MRKIKTFGIELEGGVYHRATTERVDLCKAMNLNTENGFCHTIPGVGQIGVDNGHHEIELSLSPCHSLREAEDKFGECLIRLPADWEIYWVGQDPFVRHDILPACPWAPKSRYGIIREVIQRESGYLDTGTCMDWMSQYWAYQIHLAVDLASNEGNAVRNYLDNWGPHIARSTCEVLGYPSNRIENAWIGWGDKRRLPAYRWFESPGHMLETWRHMPRLACLSENGAWVADERSDLLRPGNLIDEGFVWWGARPRWSLGTIEFRWPDSLPPFSALQLTKWILSFSEEILNGYRPYRFSCEDWKGIREDRSYWNRFVQDNPSVQISFS